jgi:transposase
MNTPSRARKPATRRRHGPALKRKLVEMTQHPGASVAAIALEHGINANLLFKWRRESGVYSARAHGNMPVLLPVSLQGAVAPASRLRPLPGASSGTIEVELGLARLRLRGAVDEASLRCLVRVLREAP